jgi:hypothetical protein
MAGIAAAPAGNPASAGFSFRGGKEERKQENLKRFK